MIIKMMNYQDELQILSDMSDNGELVKCKKPLPFTPNGLFSLEEFIKLNNTCLVIDDVLTAEIRQADDGFNLFYVLKTDDLEDALDGTVGLKRRVVTDHILELTGTTYIMNDKGTTIHSHYYIPPIPENIKNIYS